MSRLTSRLFGLFSKSFDDSKTLCNTYLYYKQLLPVASVHMVMFVWWEAPISMRVEWRCASMTSGGQCVMTSGTALMLLWSASSWDTHTLEVSLPHTHRLAT